MGRRGPKPTGTAKTAAERQADYRQRQKKRIAELEQQIAMLQGDQARLADLDQALNQALAEPSKPKGTYRRKK